MADGRNRLAGRKAIISGGASGLGACMARRFAAEGAAIGIVGLPRAEERAAVVVDSITGAGGVAFFEPADVTAASSVGPAIDVLAGRLGGADICVASAGVPAHPDAGFRGLVDLEPEHFDYVQDANVRGVFLTAQAAARHMIAGGRGGAIVTLASMASKRPSAGAYSVSKAAVWMLTRSLAMELAPHRIRVNAIGPGYVKTELLARICAAAVGTDPAQQAVWYEAKRASLPLGELPTPDDIADTALFLCSDESRMFTGSLLHPDGGLTSATGGG